ncbi:flagellar basal body L-ring protein FlgH [Primorskyibacter sp. S187A]|uniref:flagellar basal body L-ring protein FlgH n=1 Tax=Primorskyibacter sp. S187A TaxID=3415130 RepID=UPI003C7A20FC
MRSLCLVSFVLLAAAGCARIDHIGKPPTLSETQTGSDVVAMRSPEPDASYFAQVPARQSSLWSAGQRSLLGDQRAAKRGDILTVVIEIDDRAEISNSSQRSRSSSESLSIPQLLGLPQRVDPDLPTGATLADAVDLQADSSSGGDGSVKRREKLTLRIAATVVDTLPNGVLAIEGSQEVRVNFELRELLVSGYVRPEDISRQNEITYDNIASARISYGGRGQITDVQQPRIGQQILDAVLPF